MEKEGCQNMKRPRGRNRGHGVGRGNRGLGRHNACSQGWATQRRVIEPIPPFSLSSFPHSPKAVQKADCVSTLAAIVDTDRCIGCGACQEMCPVGAISVSQIARIDQNLCSGCGLCVTACPEGALSMSPLRGPATQSSSGSSWKD